MIVSAIRLRDRDLQLSADEVLRARPMIGRLRYGPNPFEGRDGRGAHLCLLMPLDVNNTEPLVQLHQAKLTIDRRGIRIEGKEDEWRRRERTSYDQVLWCRPVAEGHTSR